MIQTKRLSLVCAVPLIMLAAAAPYARACPFCDTDTAATTRAGLFDEHLISNVAASLLPFLCVLLVAALVQVGWPRMKSSQRREGGA